MKSFFKLTGKKQKFKIDMARDGKIDISFVRLDRKVQGRGWNMNYPDYFLTKNGFDSPKKAYFTYADVSHSDGGQGGVHHGYIFIRSMYNQGSDQRQLLAVHELIHVLGFALPCTLGRKDGKHMSSGIMNRELEFSLPNALYDQKKDQGCPDLKDSVYLTPTSPQPYDPLPIACNLGQKSRETLKGFTFKIPERYNHKKLIKVKKGNTGAHIICIVMLLKSGLRDGKNKAPL